MRRSSAPSSRQYSTALEPSAPTPQKATRVAMSGRAAERDLGPQVDPLLAARADAVDHVVGERVVRQVLQVQAADAARAHHLDRDALDVGVAGRVVDLEVVVARVAQV